MSADQERFRLEEMAETLHDAAAKFEELVRTNRTQLVDALWKLDQQDLRKILFVYVLIEQRRRTDRLDTDQPPSEQQCHGLSEEEADWENEGGR
jgi:hypothetical protein